MSINILDDSEDLTQYKTVLSKLLARKNHQEKALADYKTKIAHTRRKNAISRLNRHRSRSNQLRGQINPAQIQNKQQLIPSSPIPAPSSSVKLYFKT